MTARVTACVVSHGDAARLAACAAALRAQRGAALTTVAVCNLRTDGSAAAARAAGFDVVLENARPHGFGANVNAAARSAESDFVLALNPDVVLDAGCVRALVAAARRHPSAGIVAPTLRYPDGRPQPSARSFPGALDTLARRTPIRALAAARGLAERHHAPPSPAGDRRVDWAIGACLLVSRAAWTALGGFDDGFRLYVEDIDLAWRAREAGWETWQTADATAVHEHQAAIDRRFATVRTWWHLRGMARFVRRHPRVLAGAGPRRRR